MPNQVVKYTYGPLGRRIAKEVNGVLTKYVYDNEDILFEYDSSDTLTSTFVHGPGIDEPLVLEQGSNLYVYHSDGLGSVVELTNAQREVVQHYVYNSFGEVAGFDSAGVQKDPIGFGGDTKLYRYANNDPVNRIDPNGLDTYNTNAGHGYLVIDDPRGNGGRNVFTFDPENPSVVNCLDSFIGLSSDAKVGMF